MLKVPIYPDQAKSQEMFLFDTDIITNLSKKKPSLSLVRRLSTTPKSEQFISTITLGEIIYGAFKSDRPEFHLQNLTDTIIPSVQILAFDSQAAYYYGQIRADLERAGTPISHPDLQIAAIALTHNLVLVTGNTKHFERISNLQLENWIT